MATTTKDRKDSPIGQRTSRVDGSLKVTGLAKYTSDFHFPGLLYAVPVEATIAKGRITKLDISLAEKMPGVQAIFHRKNIGKISRAVLGKGLETFEIPRVADDYRRAAARAKQAGFDGVELHAANGYLIDEFLQSKTNHRTDEYGGSVENRYHFLKEVVEAVTSVWPAQRVGVHLAPNGAFNDMGSPDYREQFTFIAGQLDRFGLAYLHIVDGLAFGYHNLGEPMTLAEFRQVFHGPLMGNCGYTKETAERAIAEGHADLISFGRPFISNPDLVERFKNGWPLAEPAPLSDWSSTTGAKGYTDFPAYARSSTPS